MAELLIKAVDATHSDIIKDRRGCYKRGDIVAVAPDGHVWGLKEGLPKFWIVKVTVATVAQLQQYVETLKSADQATVLRRRAWFADTTKMPGAIRNQLQTTGNVTVTLTQVQNFLTKKGIT